MARILGIDYGTKKTGISTTDSLQIIVTGLDTVATVDLIPFLKKYVEEEGVEKIVLGKPMHKDGVSTYLQEHIDEFIVKMKKLFPEIVFDFQDERMTSIEAKSIILQSGVKKNKRRDKTLVDKISAILILQKYLRHI